MHGNSPVSRGTDFLIFSSHIVSLFPKDTQKLPEEQGQRVESWRWWSSGTHPPLYLTGRHSPSVTAGTVLLALRNSQGRNYTSHKQKPFPRPAASPHPSFHAKTAGSELYGSFSLLWRILTLKNEYVQNPCQVKIIWSKDCYFPF